MVAASVTVGIFLLCSLIAILGVPEMKVPVATGEKQSWNPFRMSKEIFTFWPFVCVLIAFCIGSLSFELQSGNIGVMFQYSYGLEAETANVLLASTVTSVLAMFPWYLFMKRFGRKAVMFTGVLIFMVPHNIVWMIMSEELFGNSLATVAYVSSVWGGIGVGSLTIAPFLITDVLDEFHLKTGKRMEAVFYSMVACLDVVADAIVLGASQLFLQFVDYDPNQCVQPDSVGSGFRYIGTVGPLVCIAIALFFLYLYPITEESRRATAQALKEKRENEENRPILSEQHATLQAYT
ncbi:sodium-dependent lysophosphatidylcholine symporter 1-like [Branchiostoma lanceolatum]|uniref:sodium-dependent lysophosphatidylcholine symporter 1-like n=1 Tax=Branchiostoma lanceolatum TaxID=7740 RepID=UPI0034556A46